LPAEGEIPTCIHTHLLRVFGEDMSSTQKWVRRVKELKQDEQNFTTNGSVVALTLQ
jgi:hypothetical protein